VLLGLPQGIHGPQLHLIERLYGAKLCPVNTKGGSITLLLTSCLTGLESDVGQLTIFVFICKTDQIIITKVSKEGFYLEDMG
jgi:hypothetical protein